MSYKDLGLDGLGDTNINLKHEFLVQRALEEPLAKALTSFSNLVTILIKKSNDKNSSSKRTFTFLTYCLGSYLIMSGVSKVIKAATEFSQRKQIKKRDNEKED